MRRRLDNWLEKAPPDRGAFFVCAVDEQAAATREIANSVRQASLGTEDVAHHAAGRDAHLAAHCEFVAKVEEFKRRIEQRSGTVSMEVPSFLRDGLSGHIRTVDVAFAAHLRGEQRKAA
jgi:hypothetical protein